MGTKYGISAPLAVQDRGLCVTAQKMKLLSEADFCDLAVKYFWQPMQCDLLPAGLDGMVFDHGFNAGAKTSVRLLQQIVGVEQDGIAGPRTLTAIGAVPVADLGRFASSGLLERLQTVLGIPVTGRLDRLTLTMVETRGCRLRLLCMVLSRLQLEDYRRKKEFRIFGDSWLARARARLQLALGLLEQDSPAAAPALA